jgi:[amino group carrier protein]-lysine/ornithine hydrolase
VLRGRGSVDAKGALAAFVRAARAFAGDEAVRVVVVGCCDEEAESHGARNLIPRHRPKALVIGEPSGVAGVTIGYKGIVRVRYALEEDLAHTGAPFPSVPDRGLAFWSALQGFLAPQHGDSLFTTPTAKLSSFTTTLTPQGRHRIEMVGSVRTPPGFDSQALLDFLRARAGRGALDVPEVDPAWVADKSSPVARAFVAAVRGQGLVPRYVKKTGTSDMNILAPAWQVPCVAYGPGDASLDHTPHERLEVAEYRVAIGVLGEALARLRAELAPDAAPRVAQARPGARA